GRWARAAGGPVQTRGEEPGGRRAPPARRVIVSEAPRSADRLLQFLRRLEARHAAADGDGLARSWIFRRARLAASDGKGAEADQGHGVAAQGQLGPSLAAPPAGVPSNASGRACASELRRCSNGSTGAARPPTFTPRLRTICVSNGFVSIATRKPHSGQRNVTLSEPSSGPSVEWSFIGWSQSRHRNFMTAPF